MKLFQMIDRDKYAVATTNAIVGEPNFRGHGLIFLTNIQLSFIVFFQKTKNSKLLNSTLSILSKKKEKEKMTLTKTFT